MNRAVVGVNDELAVGPLGIFVSADQQFQGELFEDVIVSGLEFVIGKRGLGYLTLEVSASGRLALPDLAESTSSRGSGRRGRFWNQQVTGAHKLAAKGETALLYGSG